jgi:hypothetical protein
MLTSERREVVVRPEPAIKPRVRFSNPWAIDQPLERTYGTPRQDGFGAKRAVRKYAGALRRLAE